MSKHYFLVEAEDYLELEGPEIHRLLRLTETDTPRRAYKVYETETVEGNTIIVLELRKEDA